MAKCNEQSSDLGTNLSVLAVARSSFGRVVGTFTYIRDNKRDYTPPRVGGCSGMYLGGAILRLLGQG